MDEPSEKSLHEVLRAELRRIGLDPAELTGLAIAGPDEHAFLAHLRGLRVGASWADVFPGTPADWRPGTPPPEHPLGPFDYAEAPRGPAVFASIDPDSPPDAASRAIAQVTALGHRCTAAASCEIGGRHASTSS